MIDLYQWWAMLHFVPGGMAQDRGYTHRLPRTQPSLNNNIKQKSTHYNFETVKKTKRKRKPKYTNEGIKHGRDNKNAVLNLTLFTRGIRTVDGK